MARNAAMWLGVMGEGGDEGETIDPVGMTAGKGLSDGATHRIPDH